MELPPPAAGHPAGRVPRGAPAGRRPVHRRLPPATAAARRDLPPRTAAGGTAHRRSRPRRRRVRGVPAGTARRCRGHHPRTRHPDGRGAAGGRPDLQPHPGSARRTQAPLPLPLDRLPGHRTRRRDHPQTGAGVGLTKPPGIAEAIDWAGALHALGLCVLDAAAADRTLGAVLKYAEDLEAVRRTGLAQLVDAEAGSDA